MDEILEKIAEPHLGSKTTYTDDLMSFGNLMLRGRLHGVYPSDMIPRLTETRPYAIVNLDNKYEPGSHWVALAKTNDGLLVYDSFARPSHTILPSVYGSGNGAIRDTEDDVEQADHEENCGARCVAWLILFDNWGEDMAERI